MAPFLCCSVPFLCCTLFVLYPFCAVLYPFCAAPFLCCSVPSDTSHRLLGLALGLPPLLQSRKPALLLLPLLRLQSEGARGFRGGEWGEEIRRQGKRGLLSMVSRSTYCCVPPPTQLNNFLTKRSSRDSPHLLPPLLRLHVLELVVVALVRVHPLVIEVEDLLADTVEEVLVVGNLKKRSTGQD